jgi:hypothetical protein
MTPPAREASFNHAIMRPERADNRRSDGVASAIECHEHRLSGVRS